MREKTLRLYHETLAQFLLMWLLCKWGGLDEYERRQGRREILNHLTMAKALRTATV